MHNRLRHWLCLCKNLSRRLHHRLCRWSKSCLRGRLSRMLQHRLCWLCMRLNKRLRCRMHRWLCRWSVIERLRCNGLRRWSVIWNKRRMCLRIDLGRRVHWKLLMQVGVRSVRWWSSLGNHRVGNLLRLHARKMQSWRSGWSS